MEFHKDKSTLLYTLLSKFYENLILFHTFVTKDKYEMSSIMINW